MKFKTCYLILLPLAIGLMLLSGCSSPGTAVPAQPTPSPASTQPASPGEPPPSETDTGGGISGFLSLVPTLAGIAPERTPVPTATPDALAEGVSEVVQETGLSGKTLLWLGYADWINLGISLLFVLAAYLIGTWLIRWLFPRLVRRTKTVLDDQLLQASGNELRWLAVVIILRFATNRLNFIRANVKTFVTDVYFFLTLFLLVVIVWRLINLAAKQAQDQANKAGQRKEAESLITLAVWALRLVVIITIISISLTHFGVNITGLAVFVGIVGLALSLSGRDVLADIIAGALILIDRPYRIGDRIELPGIDSWGDVVDIGMRTTRVLTLNNRMVIVPNSQIGKEQIVNYSYPDPSYYDQTDVVVAYDNDPKQVGQLLVDTVRQVEGVQTGREIDALLMEFTENHMLFQVGWWIASYDDLFPVHDRVSRAVIQGLKDAGVVLPYRKGSVNVEMHSREQDR